MLKKFSLLALQQAMNQALALDDASSAKMAELEGKVLAIQVDPLGIEFFMQFSKSKIQLMPEYAGEPDTRIHSSPLGFIRLSLLPASRARSLFNDKIRISGDLELGQAVKRLFDELDIDWEGHLAYFTGDVVAHHLGSLFNRGRAFGKQLNESMHHNLDNYLHEELQLLPSRAELEDFYQEVDTLALDVERLAAHMNRLKADYETD